MANLVDDATMLAYVGETNGTTADKALVAVLQPLVEQAIKEHVGFGIQQATYTEYHPEPVNLPSGDPLADQGPYDVMGGRLMWQGGGDLPIQLRQLPVRSVTSIYENPGAWDVASPPDFSASYLLTEGPDFRVDWGQSGICWSGLVYRQTGRWPTYRGRGVKVTYLAGFTSGEITSTFPAIQYASMAATMKAYKEAKLNQRDGMTTNWQEAKIGPMINLTMLLPSAVLRQLDGYQRYSKYI